jgi:hypothetical protein
MTKKRFNGKPCRICTGTERYLSGSCVACVAASAKRRAAKNPDGTPCVRCGCTKRYSSGQCAACVKESNERWAKANPEQFRKSKNASVRKMRAKNPQPHRDEVRAWQKANREKCNAAGKRWRDADPARAAAVTKAYRDRDREKARRLARESYARHRERILSRGHGNVRRARKLNAAPRWLKEIGQLEQINALYQTARLLGLHVDHDIPLAGCRKCGAVGLHVLANLRVALPNTNKAKNRLCGACFTGTAPGGS